MTGDALEGNEPPSARGLFAAELRRLRLLHNVSQEQVAALVVHSRATIASVEYGRQWPTRDLAIRCDDILHSGGTLERLWPLVDAERQAVREVLAGARLSDLRALVLHLAALTRTDLSVLRVTGGEEAHALPAARRHAPTGGPPWAGAQDSPSTHNGATRRRARLQAEAAKGDETTP